MKEAVTTYATRIALAKTHDSEGVIDSWETFSSLSEALASRLEQGYRTAIVRWCTVAFPSEASMHSAYDAIVDRANEDHETVASWSDFAAYEDGDIITASAEAKAKLRQMLASTFRAWAESFGCHRAMGERIVNIRAWKFSDDIERFEHDGLLWMKVTR